MWCTLLLILLMMVCKTDACGRSGRSSSSRSGSFSYDMNKQGLRRLYNSPVTKVESYSRPLGGFLGKAGLDHTGVVATTKDGGRYLIHKGSGYGKSSSTVVVDAKHMSNRWSKTGEKYTSGKTISDLMKDGYVNQKYGVGPNRKICWQSSKNIMDKSGRKKRRACR